MTHNQIDFARHREERRHNIVGERETSRHNKASESIGSISAAAAASQASASHRMATETARHNLTTEGINWYTAENAAALQSAQAQQQLALAAKTASEVGVEQQKADAATKEASTHRGAAYAEGFKDVAVGASSIIKSAGELIKSGSRIHGGVRSVLPTS